MDSLPSTSTGDKPENSSTLATISAGMGNNGSLPELRRNLDWWKRHPRMADSPRGKQRIASLSRNIAALEAEQQPQPLTAATSH